MLHTIKVSDKAFALFNQAKRRIADKTNKATTASEAIEYMAMQTLGMTTNSERLSGGTRP